MIKFSKAEIKLLQKLPITYEVLYAAMLNENIGTDKRREQIRNEAFKIRGE